jgi:hypothetical protein
MRSKAFEAEVAGPHHPHANMRACLAFHLLPRGDLNATHPRMVALLNLFVESSYSWFRTAVYQIRAELGDILAIGRFGVNIGILQQHSIVDRPLGRPHRFPLIDDGPVAEVAIVEIGVEQKGARLQILHGDVVEVAPLIIPGVQCDRAYPGTKQLTPKEHVIFLAITEIRKVASAIHDVGISG